MKAVKIILLFIAFAFKSYSQPNEEWKQYLKDSVYNSDNGYYVSLGITKGGNLYKVLNYSLKKKRYILSTVYGDSAVHFKEVFKPNLFQVVYENFDGLKLIPEYERRKKNRINFHKDYNDTSKLFYQLGIKYYDLHYNHFQTFTENQISKVKKVKLKNAMLAINQLYAIFEELEK
ncbi:MAG: hypothetical protein KA319_04455 [Ferruginibacter sp.]|nr:hypothetical protein [Ferruginibacter sp.]